MTSARASLAAVGLATLACVGPCAPPPADGALRFVFDAQEGRFARLCAEFPALGIEALGRDQGRVTLARGALQLTTAPSDAELDAVGVDRKTWKAWMTDLAVLDIGQVRRSDDGGVDFVVGMKGISPARSTTWLRCAPLPPAEAAVLEYAEPAALHATGLRCDPLRPGWWVCRDEEQP